MTLFRGYRVLVSGKKNLHASIYHFSLKVKTRSLESMSILSLFHSGEELSLQTHAHVRAHTHIY